MNIAMDWCQFQIYSVGIMHLFPVVFAFGNETILLQLQRADSPTFILRTYERKRS